MASTIQNQHTVAGGSGNHEAARRGNRGLGRIANQTVLVEREQHNRLNARTGSQSSLFLPRSRGVRDPREVTRLVRGKTKLHRQVDGPIDEDEIAVSGEREVLG